MSGLPLGRLFMLGFDGLSLPSTARNLLERDQILGAILFKRNIQSREQVRDLTASIPGLVSVDQEGGRVARLKGLIRDVPPMRELALAAKQDPDLIYRTAYAMGQELKDLGFGLDFAPVMDVDTNPQNPIIGDRSFSRDPQEVAECGVKFIQGLRAAGILACAKHFPGHGDTDLDSHLDLPVLSHGLKRLTEIEWPPFRAAIEAKVACIMTAHIMIPALDKTYPGTLSHKILTGILREKLGYGGVIVSDDLEMRAVSDRYSVPEMVRLGLLAGVDFFLMCSDLDKVHKALDAAHDCIDNGKVPKEQVEQTLKRIDALSF